MEKFILALDQGTTSSRAILFDRKGTIRSKAQKEFKQYFPKPGWVEHDAQEIWSTQAGVAAEAVSHFGIGADQIAAVGITNQRETTIIWDRASGKPIYHAIVWQDRRTSDICDDLKKKGYESLIREKTGLVIDAYFSGTKIKWILDHVPEARKKAEQGELAFGTVDSWLVWNFTKGKTHVTDVTNASRTMLFNIHTLDWDDELLEWLDIPKSLLPKVVSCSEIYALSSGQLLGEKIPISGMAGDQQAALFGQMCTQPGMVKNTYGTGCFLMMNTGDQAITSQNNLLTTVAWKLNDQVCYALEGSIFIGGAVIQWIRDGLGFIQQAPEVERLASEVPDSDGVYLVPAFAGLGAPYWDQHARGTLVGLTRGSTSAHIARAALESIAFQTRDVLTAMEADAHMGITELRVDGGATSNNLLMQFQADVLRCAVIRPQVTETTALGAAYMAGLAVGYWSDIQDIRDNWQVDRRFDPTLSEQQLNSKLHEWTRAVKTAQFWASYS